MAKGSDRRLRQPKMWNYNVWVSILKNSRYGSDLKFVQNKRDIKVKNWMKEKCN